MALHAPRQRNRSGDRRPARRDRDARLRHLAQRRQRHLGAAGGATGRYTTSKIACWATLHRALELSEQGQIAAKNRERWLHEREQIRGFVEERCWSQQRGAYAFYAGTSDLDASVLLAPRMGFCEPARRALRRDARRGPRQASRTGRSSGATAACASRRAPSCPAPSGSSRRSRRPAASARRRSGCTTSWSSAARWALLQGGCRRRDAARERAAGAHAPLARQRRRRAGAGAAAAASASKARELGNHLAREHLDGVAVAQLVRGPDSLTLEAGRQAPDTRARAH